MKKLERKMKRLGENYLKMETSGLSRERDAIIAVSLIEKNSEVLKTFYVENFKDERNLLEEVLPLLQGKKFVTYSGRSFDLPFIRKKVKFYFKKDLDFNFIDLQDLTKSYNFIFNLDSHSNKALLEKFIGLEKLKDQKEYQGIKIKSLFKKYLEGDETAMGEILDYNYMSLNNLILLDAKIKEELEKNLSLKILGFTFFIEDLKLLDNKLEISGETNYESDFFSTNELYSLEISELERQEKNSQSKNFQESRKIYESEKSCGDPKNIPPCSKNSESENFQESRKIYESGKNNKLNKKFSIKINTEDGLYDGKTFCYYVKKKDLDFKLTNPSKIKSPPQIQILYYKNHLYENQKELIIKIIEKELGE